MFLSKLFLVLTQPSLLSLLGCNFFHIFKQYMFLHWRCLSSRQYVPGSYFYCLTAFLAYGRGPQILVHRQEGTKLQVHRGDHSSRFTGSNHSPRLTGGHQSSSSWEKVLCFKIACQEALRKLSENCVHWVLVFVLFMPVCGSIFSGLAIDSHQIPGLCHLCQMNSDETLRA